MTASLLLWRAAGQPAPPYPLTIEAGVCRTCGGEFVAGIDAEAINNPTFSQHADYFRSYGNGVCQACGWLYGLGKSKPGNIVAAGDALWSPLLSHDNAAAQGRPTWIDVLREIAAMPADTPVAGVLTTDVKPRLWPRMELGTRAAMPLVVHCPDYDISGLRWLDVDRLLTITEVVGRALGAGYSKRRCVFGLPGDYDRFRRDPARSIALEAALAPWRELPEFIPAVLVSGPIREDDNDERATRHADASGAARGGAGPTQPGLF